MKRIYLIAMAAAMMTQAQAQDFVLTLADGTSKINVTLPAGEYDVDGQTVTSDGTAMDIAVKYTTVEFARTDGEKITKFVAIGQPSIIGFSSTTGTGLEVIDLHDNGLTSFSMNINAKTMALRELYLSNNKLASVSFSGTRWNNLEILDISDNEFTSLSTTNLISLRQLLCSNNKLATLSTGYASNLRTLWCEGNELKALELKNNPKVESVVADNNVIAKVTTPADGLVNIVDFWASNNQLEKADLGGGSKLHTLDLSNNEMVFLSLEAPEKQIFYADLSGNQLPYGSVYDAKSVLNYMFNANPVLPLDKERYAWGETITLPELGSKTLSGTSLSLNTKWVDAETGSNIATSKYTTVAKNSEFYFKQDGFTGHTYATVTDRYFTGMSVKTKTVEIFDPMNDSVRDLRESGFTYGVVPGGLQMTSSEPKAVSVVDLNGRVIWSGTVTERGVLVDGLNGTYVVNGIKIAI